MFLPITIATILATSVPPPASAPGSTSPPERGIVFEPLPERGPIPHVVPVPRELLDAAATHRAEARDYRAQVRQTCRAFFGRTRNESLRRAGMARLTEFTDPAAFPVLLEETKREGDDVRLAVLEHLAAQGDDGQVALARAVIHHDDEAMRYEALRRLESPAVPGVVSVLDQELRSARHETANRAAGLAQHLGAIQTLPLLIQAAATRDPRPTDVGDLAWIAIETQHAFVVGLVPVVGNNAVAYQPVTGVVHEGVLLRVTDAVVIVYRTQVFAALQHLSEQAWGRPTGHLGQDQLAWRRWYNEEFVPWSRDTGSVGGG